MDKVDTSTAALLNSSLVSGLKQDTKKLQNKKGINQKNTFTGLMEASLAELGPMLNLEASEEALTLLLDAVHSSGSDLLERPFHDEIIKYKRSVRDFMNYIVKNGYEILTIQGIKKRVVINGEADWKATIFHQINIIDKKLDELAAAILSGQSSQLERVSKIEGIKGLLVDLTITGVIKNRDD